MGIPETYLIVIVVTGLISSAFSLGAKLLYDGIKSKKRNLSSNDITHDFSLLEKDMALNNERLEKIEKGVSNLGVNSATSNVHLLDLKTSIIEQTATVRGLIATLMAAMSRLEDKL